MAATEGAEERRRPRRAVRAQRAVTAQRPVTAPRAVRARCAGRGGCGSTTASSPAPTSAVLLLVLMFGAKWYGVAGVPDPSAARPAITTTVNGFNGLTDVRWVMLLTIGAALGSVLLHASQRSHGARTDTSRVLVGLGSLTAILLIYRVLIAFPAASRTIDQKLGAYLGLLCAFGMALGARQSMLEQEARTRAASTRRRRGVRAPRRRGERRVGAGRRSAGSVRVGRYRGGAGGRPAASNLAHA